jgi:hypothetical protein
MWLTEWWQRLRAFCTENDPERSPHDGHYAGQLLWANRACRTCTHLQSRHYVYKGACQDCTCTGWD